MKRTAAIATTTLIIGLMLGFGASDSVDPANAAPAPVVQPTPQVIVKEVEVPGPVQTERVEVPVTPPACRDLIGTLAEVGGAQNGLLVDILAAYVDYPDENLLDFGRRVEAILSEANLPTFPTNYQSLVDECLGTLPTGASS